MASPVQGGTLFGATASTGGGGSSLFAATTSGSSAGGGLFGAPAPTRSGGVGGLFGASTPATVPVGYDAPTPLAVVLASRMRCLADEIQARVAELERVTRAHQQALQLGVSARDCRGGHGLARSKVMNSTVYCNVCARSFAVGETTYSCRSCNWDVCPACFNSQW
jgi:hypothetical protein